MSGRQGAPTFVCGIGTEDVEDGDAVEDEGGSVSTLNGAGDCAWCALGSAADVVAMCIKGRWFFVVHGRELPGCTCTRSVCDSS